MKALTTLLASFAMLVTMFSIPATAEIYCTDDYYTDNSFSRPTIERLEACLEYGRDNGRDIDGQREDGKTLFNLILLEPTPPEFTDTMLKEGADPNHYNDSLEYFNTPFMQAAIDRKLPYEQYYRRLELLLDAGADLNAVDVEGWTGFAYVLSYHPFRLELADLLIEHDADFSIAMPNYGNPDQPQTSWVVQAMNAGADLETLKKIDKLTDENYQALSLGQNTDLHMSAQYSGADKLEIAKWLVSKGVDPSLQNAEGKYAWELVEDDPEVVSYLRQEAGMN